MKFRKTESVDLSEEELHEAVENYIQDKTGFSVCIKFDSPVISSYSPGLLNRLLEKEEPFIPYRRFTIE